MLNPGTVYDLKGAKLLYVRTEGGKHHFVGTRNGVVYHHKLPEVPAEAELIIDQDGRKQAQEAQVELQIERWNKDLAFRLLRQACAWLPLERYRQLQQEYQDKCLEVEAG